MDRDRRFGHILRHHRKAAGLTQEELAEHANLSVRGISDLERGLRTVPRRETVELLAQALDLPCEQLEASVRRNLTPAGPRRGLPAPAAIPQHAFPLSLTSLLGREQEVSLAVHLLAHERVRILTLIGPGGVGKTRLALQVAADLEGHFQDGVVLVELAPVRHVRFVLSAIAVALGVHESGRMPLAQSICAYLQGRKLLLVLDNCEHLLDAGLLVANLLPTCQGLSVLATSREPFHLRGEHQLDVLPLPVPGQVNGCEIGELVQFSSVALFLRQVRVLAPTLVLDDESVRAAAEICQRLDGLPLAIELAASRIKLLPPKALLGRLSRLLPLLTTGLRDGPLRHQTLRDTIDWSYQLLSPDEQSLFTRLSVFAGGWTLEEAEAICADGNLNVLEGMASLMDKSLVRQQGQDELRFSMLETVREYAQEQLEARRQGWAIRRRHAERFLTIASDAELDLPGRNQASWLKRLNCELDNFRTALAWWRDSGEIDKALRLASALQWFWYDGGHWTEGCTWLETLLTLDIPPHRTPGRAGALTALGGYNRGQSSFAAGRAHLEESLAIWQELDDARGMGRALTELAVIVAAQGEAARARSLSEESLALARAAGDQSYVALALHSLGILAGQEGDDITARSRLEQSRGVWRELDNRGMQSLASNSLGDLARSRGRFVEAAAYYRESLELAEDSATRQMQAVYLHNLGHATHRLGDRDQARTFFAEALDQFRELRDRRGMAECVAGLAGLDAEREPERTARLFGATSAIVDAMGTKFNPSNQSDYDYALTDVRARLGDSAFDAAWGEGRSMTLEQAIGEAVRNAPVG